MITGFKFWAASPPLLAVVWLIEWWTNLWPVVPTLVALLVLDRPIALRLALLYVLGGAIAICLFTAAGQLLRGTLNTAPLTNIFWGVVSLAWTASIPFAVIVLTGWRRVRAVMPLALAGTLLFGFGSMLFRELLIRALNVEAFRSAFLSGAVFSSHRDAAVCAVHAREPSRRLARVAAPERAGRRIREQAIQRHPAGRRLLVGGRRCRSDGDVAVDRRMAFGWNRRRCRRLSGVSTCRGCGASRRPFAATGPASLAASGVRLSGAHRVAVRSCGADMAAPGSRPAHRGRRSCDAHRRSRRMCSRCSMAVWPRLT